MFRRVHEITFAVEKHEVLHISVCVCVGEQARECSFARVVLIKQHATRFHIAIRILSGSTIFFDIYLINGTIFEKCTEYKMCFYFQYNFYMK